MKQRQFVLTGQLQRDEAKAAIDAAEAGQVVTIRDRNRSLEQNALLHMWYGEIAKQKGDCTLIDVKGQCHHKYGLPIKLADPKFAWVWKHSGATLNYEQQCSLLASGVMPVSSTMTKAELNGYMMDMSMDYRAEGVILTDPALMGYEWSLGK